MDIFRKLYRNCVYYPNFSLVSFANVAIVLVLGHAIVPLNRRTLRQMTMMRQMNAVGADGVVDDDDDVWVCPDHYCPLVVVTIDDVALMLDLNCK